MPDVSIYVALIAGGAGLVPQILLWQQHVGQAKLARREQATAEVRRFCQALYDAAVDVETEVRRNRDYRGTDMAARLAKVRELAAAADKTANTIAFLSPDGLATAARQVADSAREISGAADENTDLVLGALVMLPDFAELDKTRGEFRRQAVAYLRG